MSNDESKPRSALLLAQNAGAQLKLAMKIDDCEEQSEIRQLKQSTDKKQGSGQRNAMLILLQQVIQWQGILLEVNKNLKDDTTRQQTYIGNLLIEMETLQVADAARRGTAHDRSLLSTANTQHVLQPLNTFALQAAKQLQAKQIAKLLEIPLFTGSPTDEAEEWFIGLEEIYKDVQLDNYQRLSVARELLTGSAKL
jgi:hypothetical protein